MRGHILRYSINTSTGAISGDDGQRYKFFGSDWDLPDVPTQGMYIDFDVEEGRAVDIMMVPSASPVGAAVGSKNRIVAALLAFFLGGLGIHKFYLGYGGVGVVYILISLTIIGLLFTGVASLIDAVLYLVKSDEEFDKVYVQGRRPWF